MSPGKNEEANLFTALQYGAYEVGGGKTMIMCVASYEMKRIGVCHKPMIIGLKANVHEIAATTPNIMVRRGMSKYDDTKCSATGFI